jgi:hypothetical protein
MRFCFLDLLRPTSPAEPGSRIDAGLVTLHPDFMSYMPSW